MKAHLAFILLIGMSYGQDVTTRPQIVGEPPIFRTLEDPESQPSHREPISTDLASPAIEADTVRREREFQKRVRDATPIPELQKKWGSLFIIVAAALLIVIVIGAWLLRRSPR